MAGARVISRRRNPLHHPHELPYGEWVPAHAVKFNDDGTVDVMTESQHNRGMPNVAGYKDATGFHPIRWDPEYDPDEITVFRGGRETTEALYPSTHSGLPVKRRRPKAKKRRR